MIAYAGGVNVNATFVGDSFINVVDNIKAQLLNAGWSVASGASGDWIVRSALTPSGSQIDVRLFSSGAFARVKFQRTGLSMSQAPPLDPSQDLLLLPLAAKTFRIIANRYQFFVLVPGSSNFQDFCCGGVMFQESFQTSYVAWCHGNAPADGSSSRLISFRTACSLLTFAQTFINSWQVSDSSHLVLTLNNWQGDRCQRLVVPIGQVATNTGEGVDNAGRRWHTDEAFKIPARICYGVATLDSAVERGQLWDAVIVTQEYPIDHNPIVFDGHNWYNLTVHGVETSVSLGLPSLFVVIP